MPDRSLAVATLSEIDGTVLLAVHGSVAAISETALQDLKFYQEAAISQQYRFVASFEEASPARCPVWAGCRQANGQSFNRTTGGAPAALKGRQFSTGKKRQIIDGRRWRFHKKIEIICFYLYTPSGRITRSDPGLAGGRFGFGVNFDSSVILKI